MIISNTAKTIQYQIDGVLFPTETTNQRWQVYGLADDGTEKVTDLQVEEILLKLKVTTRNAQEREDLIDFIRSVAIFQKNEWLMLPSGDADMAEIFGVTPDGEGYYTVRMRGNRIIQKRRFDKIVDYSLLLRLVGG